MVKIAMDEWNEGRWVAVDGSWAPDEFVADNDYDGEVTEAVIDLVCGKRDEIELGGGAAERIRLRAVR